MFDSILPTSAASETGSAIRPDRLHLRIPDAARAVKDFRGVLLGALDQSRESPAARQASRVRLSADEARATNAPGATEAERRRFELRKATGEFESILTTMLMKSMRATIHKNEMFHGGRGEQVFQEMLDQTIARSTSQSRGLGIGEMLYNQFARLVANPPPAEGPAEKGLESAAPSNR